MVKCFAIFDIKAEAYMQPFFFSTVGQAMRAFKDLVSDGKSNVSRHPEDFFLDMIGEFSDDSGVLVGSGPTRLGRASEFVSKDVPLGLVKEVS